MHGKYQDDKNCILTGNVIRGVEYFKNIYLALLQSHKKCRTLMKSEKMEADIDRLPLCFLVCSTLQAELRH